MVLVLVAAKLKQTTLEGGGDNLAKRPREGQIQLLGGLGLAHLPGRL